MCTALISWPIAFGFRFWVCARVGIELPTVEVRFENLTIDAQCYVGGRALPTLWNTVRNFVEVREAWSHHFSFCWICYLDFHNRSFQICTYIRYFWVSSTYQGHRKLALRYWKALAVSSSHAGKFYLLYNFLEESEHCDDTYSLNILQDDTSFRSSRIGQDNSSSRFSWKARSLFESGFLI